MARKALVQAAEQLGGMDALAKRLGLSIGALRVYFMGSEPVPEQLFLRIVDVLQPSLQPKTPPKQ